MTRTGEVVQAAVRFEWTSGGPVSLDVSGKPVFPALPARPGIYRFTLTTEDGALASVYIGESDNLKRRMGNYRNPGPSQQTSLRLNARIRELLGRGGTIDVVLATEVTVDGETLDLSAKAARLVAENVALIRARQASLSVENL